MALWLFFMNKWFACKVQIDNWNKLPGFVDQITKKANVPAFFDTI